MTITYDNDTTVYVLVCVCASWVDVLCASWVDVLCRDGAGQ